MKSATTWRHWRQSHEGGQWCPSCWSLVWYWELFYADGGFWIILCQFCPTLDFVQGDFVQGILSKGFVRGDFVLIPLQYIWPLVPKRHSDLPLRIFRHELCSLFSKEYSMDNIFKGKLMKLNDAFIVILVSSIFLVIQQSHKFTANSQIRTPLVLTVILRYRKSNKSSGGVLK